MKLTDIPAKQAVPFGVNGQREALLPTTPAGDNKASYNNGFPPVTMILKSAGGVPPKGQDMNQILFELSSLCRWFSAGGAIPFDQSFCTAISGYPKGARILGNDGYTVYISTIDSNTNDPNTSSTGWLNLAKLSSIAGLSGGANKLPYFTGNDTADQTDITQVGRDIIGKGSIDAILQYLQLGGAAKLNVGTTSGTVAAGDDVRLSQQIGIGQTWKNVLSSRSVGVNYVNSENRPIAVFVEARPPISGTSGISVDDVIVATAKNINADYASFTAGCLAIVPPGSTYIVKGYVGSNPTITTWSELS
ncbi:hypothetical protein [Edwardsiella ictaluri]|uniref:hypothetical protein n=1 Tax=Edwardsiella ictaluri TaxID=67780 RepID=UPI001E4572BF|nr:hypothetical protein [Edwardsiella ictaluri]